MYGRADKGNHLDRFQVFIGKLKPQAKEEQGYADFGQKLYIVNFVDGDAAGVLAQQNTGQDVAQNKRLVQALHDEPAEKSGDDQNNDIGGDAHRCAVLFEKKVGFWYFP